MYAAECYKRIAGGSLATITPTHPHQTPPPRPPPSSPLRLTSASDSCGISLPCKHSSQPLPGCIPPFSTAPVPLLAQAVVTATLLLVSCPVHVPLLLPHYQCFVILSSIAGFVLLGCHAVVLVGAAFVIDALDCVATSIVFVQLLSDVSVDVSCSPHCVTLMQPPCACVRYVR